MAIDFDKKDRVEHDLTGRTVVVVGGGQMPGAGMGNGRAISIVAARHGAEVVAVARHLDRAQATIDMIEEEGGKGYAIETDVSTPEGCKLIFDEVRKKSGRLDAMVYNVAINVPFDYDTQMMAVEDFNRGIDVNMLGCYWCNRYAAELMQDKEGEFGTKGAIVNISSIASLKNTLGMTIGILPYSLGKCGLNYITEMSAVEYASQGIRVNTLMLGPINSVLSNTDSKTLFNFNEEEKDEAYGGQVKLAMGRASVWESAEAALFLISDESRFMTGQLIRLDGGATLFC